MNTRLVIIHAQSPLHAGTGQSVGTIDLPIARERATGIPLLHGSSIKGALRARSGSDPLTTVLFGPDTRNSSDHSGAVQFADAHLVLLPVRSVAGTFAWTTSPYLFRRLARDARHAGLDLGDLPKGPAAEGQCVVPPASVLIATAEGGVRRVVFEDLDFEVVGEPSDVAALGKLANTLGSCLENGDALAAFLEQRICLVHDDVMAFLLDTATDVVARIRLDEEKKTVAKGALWYEESLPTESVLAGLAVGWDVKGRNGQEPMGATQLLKKVSEIASEGWIQLGGKATTGRGLCSVRVCGGGR
jgi:CRISPR-associated protein Cmr4